MKLSELREIKKWCKSYNFKNVVECLKHFDYYNCSLETIGGTMALLNDVYFVEYSSQEYYSLNEYELLVDDAGCSYAMARL